jgi:DNA-binding Xre family transcriptional regulator
MKFDYTKLKQKMIEKKINQGELAARIGIKDATFSNRMNSTTNFTQNEILNICLVLSINPRQIDQYFFTLEVQ